MSGDWKTTKEHYFLEGDKQSLCGQVTDDTAKITCQMCEKILNSPAKRQMTFDDKKIDKS